jgi:UDP-2,3-diacylglucosamine pyrophosphatase LpxH
LVIVAEGIAAGTYPRQYRKTLEHSRRRLAHRRLTQVFEAAKRVPFDDDSRIVFFSDCHRGDNSRADGFARNEALFLHALNHYYRAGFTYVEVGDGDELWKNRRFSAVRRAHGRVFDLLHRFDRQGRLHLIVGNHDIQGSQRSRVEKDGLVAHEGLVLHHSRTRQRVFVVHGHQVDFKSDRLRVVGRFAARHVWKRLQLLGLGSRPSRAGGTRNRERIQQRIVEWLQANRQIVICGHTHRPVCAAYGAPPYFNTGSCLYAGYITGLEIQNGEITLVKWSAEPRTRRNGARRAARQLLAPPRRLRLFG